MIEGTDPGGAVVGHVDSHPRTVADDNAFDETGLTASIGGPLVDREPRRPSWVPVGE